ncbi:MAG: hypothetical protein KBA11_08320 [Sedimentibacter sp.]|nr:hypothetical protein [Sedimentibacter sp.]
MEKQDIEIDINFNETDEAMGKFIDDLFNENCESVSIDGIPDPELILKPKEYKDK